MGSHNGPSSSFFLLTLVLVMALSGSYCLDVVAAHAAPSTSERAHGHMHGSTVDLEDHHERESEAERRQVVEKVQSLHIGRSNLLSSAGGSVQTWDSDNPALQEAGKDVRSISLNPGGLAIPKYSSGGKLLYVKQGSLMVALAVKRIKSEINKPQVREVKEGDFIAIPPGVVHWYYNHMQHVSTMLSIGDSSASGEYQSFYVDGGGHGKEMGSALLWSFDDDLLNEAFNVTPKLLQKMKFSQPDTVITLHGRVQISSMTATSSDSIANSSDVVDVDDPERVHNWFKEVQYTRSIDAEPPFVQVADGGSLHMLTGKQFPYLKKIGMAGIYVRLAPDAMLAPSFSKNAHVVMYVKQGRGRVQVVGTNAFGRIGRGSGTNAFGRIGRGDGKLLNKELTEGDVVVVPQFAAAIMKASSEGFEYIAIATSHSPMFTAMAGKNAMTKEIPLDVLAASANVSEDDVQDFQNGRQHDRIIFPAAAHR